MEHVNIGNRVRGLREEQGLSLRELARRADMTATGVSLVEQGQTNPSSDTLMKLARGLGVQPGDLFPKAIAR